MARRLAVVLVAVAVPLAGCGTKTLKVNELEDSIASQFKAQGVPLHDISCPDDIEAKQGKAIHCTALNPSETKLYLEGRVVSVKDGKANFHVKAVRGVAHGSVIAAQARTLLEQKVGQRAKGMTCPRAVPIPTKPTVTCELQTLDGKRYDATVTIDAQSRIDVKVAPNAKP